MTIKRARTPVISPGVNSEMARLVRLRDRPAEKQGPEVGSNPAPHTGEAQAQRLVVFRRPIPNIPARLVTF